MDSGLSTNKVRRFWPKLLVTLGKILPRLHLADKFRWEKMWIKFD